MDWSAGLSVLGSPILFSKKSWSPDSWFHAGWVGGNKGRLEADGSGGTPGAGINPFVTVLEGWVREAESGTSNWWELVDEDGAEGWEWETLTCSYLHRPPYEQTPFW